MKLCLLFVIFACLVCLVISVPEQDRIQNLPGIDHVSFNQFAGYITYGSKNSFYWFVESQRDPKTSPVVLWVNGGPGASSLYGFGKEHGPFIIHPNQTLSFNPYSWNKIANVIYLEAPVGVGFSYSTNSNDYKNQGDQQTATDNYHFLLGFFEQFPEFTANDFYITGESYGGHYCPQLADAINTGNKNFSNNFINLKGLFVGNPWTDDFWDGVWSPPRYAYGRGLVSKQTFDALMTNCDNMYNTSSSQCQNSMSQWYKEQGFTGGAVNLGYNQLSLYEECYHNPPTPSNPNGFTRVPIACVNQTALTTYLNSKEVQTAIHAKLPAGEVWGSETDLDYTSQSSSVVPIYNSTLISNYRITIYSGDCTTNCQFMGSEAWLDSLNLNVVDDWHQWKFNITNGDFAGVQTGGWTKKYEHDVSLITIKGAGHMVPQYRPREAFVAFENFLLGNYL